MPSIGAGGKDTSWGAATKSGERGGSRGGLQEAGQREKQQCQGAGKACNGRSRGCAGRAGEEAAQVGGAMGVRFSRSFRLFHLRGRDHTFPCLHCKGGSEETRWQQILKL